MENPEGVGGSYLRFPPWWRSGYFLEIHIMDKKYTWMYIMQWLLQVMYQSYLSILYGLSWTQMQWPAPSWPDAKWSTGRVMHLHHRVHRLQSCSGWIFSVPSLAVGRKMGDHCFLVCWLLFFQKCLHAFSILFTNQACKLAQDIWHLSGKFEGFDWRILSLTKHVDWALPLWREIKKYIFT